MGGGDLLESGGDGGEEGFLGTAAFAYFGEEGGPEAAFLSVFLRVVGQLDEADGLVLAVGFSVGRFCVDALLGGYLPLSLRLAAPHYLYLIPKTHPCILLPRALTASILYL